jgi:glucuronoarabinoxylan endo-1,4-beta-xylanase
MTKRLTFVLPAILLAASLIGCGGSGNGGGGGGGTPPAAPTGITATGGNAQVTLAWNASAGATGYYAKRSSTSGGPYTQLGSTAATNFTDTGLTNGTTYYYVVSAYNSAGESPLSAEVNATPLCTPTAVVATTGDTHIGLTWDGCANATSYNVKRSTTSGGPYSTVGSPAVAAFTDTSLTDGTTYYYVVTAVYASAESANSAEVSGTPAPAVAGTSTTVNFGSSLQTIRGFGGASAWIVDMNSHPGQAAALYGTGAGQIGLSILRVRIDPSTTTTPNALWATELGNAQAAIAAGSSVSVIATPWTPPAAWKSNDNTVQGSLNTANYADYANYLESFVTYMANGNPPVNLYGISMQNEPDANVTYESCVWTGAQMDTWVASLNPNPLTTKLIMPESEGFNTAYSDPALADPNAVGNIGMIAGHLYGASPFYYTNAEKAGKEVWMTEHTISDTGVQGAMELAKEIHDSMTVGQYNAYVYWWLQDWIVGNSSPFVNGLIDDPALDNNITLNGYAMGQFSKFIRPGYVQSTVTNNNPTTNVYVSAYSGNGHYVIVAINLGTADVSQPFSIQGQTITSMTPYVTSSVAETMAQQSAVSVSGNQFTYTLPAQSIATFVQ